MAKSVRVRLICGLYVTVFMASALSCRDDPTLPEVAAHLRIPRDIHQAIQLDEAVYPCVIGGSGATIGLCVETPGGSDPNQWSARLSFGAVEGELAKPVNQGDGVMCFEMTVPQELEAGLYPLCGVLVDDYDRSRWSIPCRDVYIDRENTDDESLGERYGAAIGLIGAQGIDSALPKMEELAKAAVAQGRLLLPVRLALVAVHYLELEGDAASLRQAARQLEALPDWLGQPGFGAWHAQQLHAKANLEFRPGGDFRHAGECLKQADALLRQTLDPVWIGLKQTKTELVARLGNVRDGLQELQSIIELCQSEKAGCHPYFTLLAYNQYAWLMVQNEEAATAREIEEAERWLAERESPFGSLEALEQTNYWINRAHLQLLLARDPGPFLARAGRLLAGQDANNERARFLMSWRRLVEAQHAVEEDALDRAMAICEALQDDANPRVYTQAWACMGEIYRRRGEPEQALARFEAALLHYERAFEPGPGQMGDFSPGLRGYFYASAARAAVDLRRYDHAWRLLEDMDALAEDENGRRRCRQASEEPARWRALEARIGALKDEHRRLVASPNLSEERIRRLATEIRALRRDWPGCADRARSGAGVQPDFRAIALEDEVLLLRREKGGEARLERRAPMARRDIQALLAAIEGDGQHWSRDQWRERLAPLAAAMVPRDLDGLGPVVRFGLHGLLQRTPLAALPIVPPAGAGAPEWLGEAVWVVLAPAGVPMAPAAESGASGAPLFLLDPKQNLAGTEKNRAFYHELFADARIRAGGEADSQAMRELASGASWLHVDAHGVYDPVVPELSGFELADGVFTLIDLENAPLALRFANLSACYSGRWPTTADSGRYGLAGLVARRGAEWVVGARGLLNDRLARDFNRAFYTAIAKGESAPDAYGGALATVRDRYPPSQWGMLFLMHGRAAAANH